MRAEPDTQLRNKFLKPIYDWVQANSPGSAMIPYCSWASSRVNR